MALNTFTKILTDVAKVIPFIDETVATGIEIGHPGTSVTGALTQNTTLKFPTGQPQHVITLT